MKAEGRPTSAAEAGVWTDAVESWGRLGATRHLLREPAFADALPALANGSLRPLLAIGAGRSYGQSGLNGGGTAIRTTQLDRLIAFDPESRLLTVEAGATLSRILEFAVPRGLFLPVTPGTRHITVAGAVANDVHGKNHHAAGTFGRWVRAIRLVRGDGSVTDLTPDDPIGLFAATIGGLGLTGVIERVTIELVPIASARMETETLRFSDLDGFFRVDAESAGTWPYTVAWVDALASGPMLGRGLYTRARFAEDGDYGWSPRPPRLSIPFDAPSWLLGRPSVALFNAWRMESAPAIRAERVPFERVFYPLDGIGYWNRLYGRRGFFQYQCVVPPDVARNAVEALLGRIAAAGEASFLAVLKTFGPLRSPGLLSFPAEGTTLALDFPNRGPRTLALLASLDAIVLEAGGRLYPAKDARLPPALFRAGHGAAIERFAAHVDPACSSDFWKAIHA